MSRKLSLPGQRHEDTSDLEMDELDMDRLERELEGDGTESDSSLDLHTPFASVFSLLSSSRCSHCVFLPL